jgi:hypothetical protein
MVIGFWNIGKNNNKKPTDDFSEVLIDFVAAYGIDILLLAEVNDVTTRNFLMMAQRLFPAAPFYHIVSSKARTTLLTSYSPALFEDKSGLYPSSRWDSFLLQLPGKIPLNLISVHFYSKVNWSESSLALECANFARDIFLVEENTGCKETILIGDFNMNPFEDGMVAANGLHALQDLDYTVSAQRRGKRIDGTKYKYFYNPMWNFFGDFKRPMGTHYHRTAGHVSQEWNTYDQVIFRPSLKIYLPEDYVRIIDRIGSYDLTSKFGRPNKKDYSDHLPILFKLNI